MKGRVAANSEEGYHKEGQACGKISQMNWHVGGAPGQLIFGWERGEHFKEEQP